MRDLRETKWIYLKAFLFVAIGICSGVMIVLGNPTIQAVLFLGLCVWAFCRAYYFAFYVIERYVDPAFKFSGLLSAVRYLWVNRAGK